MKRPIDDLSPSTERDEWEEDYQWLTPEEAESFFNSQIKERRCCVRCDYFDIHEPPTWRIYVHHKDYRPSLHCEGCCVRHAPVIIPYLCQETQEIGPNWGCWPEVSWGEWCGDFRATDDATVFRRIGL